MGKLEGKRAIVTGAASGIGKAIATAFAAEGATVAVLDLDDAGAERTAQEIGNGAFSLKADVANEDDINRAVQEAIQRLGGGVDIMVNNAGIVSTGNVSDMPLSQWQEMIDVNLTGVFLGSKAVLPAMLEQGSGRIINLGSQLGLCGAPGLSHYCAAKGAVHAFSKSLAYELAPKGITVNSIAPGPTETAILDGVSDEHLAAIKAAVPLGRFAKPEEIAPTAVLLASEEGGAYYTGSTLNVSGGHVMA
jgi:3-oxoacyl-[acyl-carrier protein] reductase